MNIVAIVIWYNPLNWFLDHILSYSNDVNKVVVIDNSSGDNSYLLKTHPDIEYVPLYENLGIAAALNVGMRRAAELEADWVLTMDQDSYFDKGAIQAFLNPAATHFAESNVAIFAPCEYPDRENTITDLEFIITSGSLTNMEMYQESAGYREELFIDEVDHEYCFQMRRKGYRILHLEGIHMHHTLGNPTTKRVFGRRLSTLNHSPDRKYYMTRNRLYVRKLYPEFEVPYLKMFFWNMVRIILIEEQKLVKISRVLKGIVDYNFKNMGKINK